MKAALGGRWSLASSPLTRFATGNELVPLTAPMISNLFPAGANPASTGEVILWGYVCNPMRLSRRGRGTQAMVATLKRPPSPKGGLPWTDREPFLGGEGGYVTLEEFLREATRSSRESSACVLARMSLRIPFPEASSLSPTMRTFFAFRRSALLSWALRPFDA